MKDVFVVSDNIVSPLGNTSDENFLHLKENLSGIEEQKDPAISDSPFVASLFEKDRTFLTDPKSQWKYSRFEQLLILSIEDAISNTAVLPSDDASIIILASTKGNIDMLEKTVFDEELQERISLHHSAKHIGSHFNAAHEPLLISHACISGLLAIITGMRLIQSGLYTHAIVAGADLISKFILSGFQAFQAISPEPCQPFDAARKGITLGEAAGCIILSAKKPRENEVIQVCGGSVSNDANHISGPSRTGQELYQAIRRAVKEAGLQPADIDFISAHGTATLYNDEMEAKAIGLAGLQTVPVNSLKGYYGHTLGAAGLIETIISIYSLKQNLLLPTRGFKHPGTSQPVNVSALMQSGYYTNCLKTASGFGGCNAALVIKKTA